MTAPIQEPTQGRVDQGLAYRTRQLARRPAPAGGGSTPVFAVMYRLNSDATQSIADNTRTNLKAVRFSTSDQSVFATAATAVGSESNTTGDEVLLLKQPGTYTALMVCQFNNNNSGGTYARDVLIEDAGGTTNYLSHADTPANTFTALTSAVGTTLFHIDAGGFLVAAAGLSAGIKVTCYQNSGVSKVLDNYYLYVTYQATADEIVVY